MALKFRRGTTAQQSGSLAFGEPYVNTTLGTLLVGGDSGDIILATAGTSSTGNFGPISGSGLDITGNANIHGNLTLGGAITIGDATADTVNVVASLSSSLIPSDDNKFDVGRNDKRYRGVYANTLSASVLEIESSSWVEIRLKNSSTGIDYHIQNTAGGNFSIHNAEINASTFRIDSGSTLADSHVHVFADLYVSTGSIHIGTETTSPTGSFGILRATDTISGSITGIGNVSAYSSSVNSRLVVVEGVSASAAGALNSVSGAFATTLSNLDTNYATDAQLSSVSGAFVTTISNLGSTYATDSELSAVSSAVAVRDAAQDVLISSLQSNILSASVFTTFSTSVDSRLDVVEGVSASAASALNSVSGAVATTISNLGSTYATDAELTTLSTSVDSRLDSLEVETSALESFTSSINTTIKTKLDSEGVISGSSQLTSSYDNRYVTLDGPQTINGTKTFNDIVVNGTGSFAYITSTSGNAKIIGDAFIVVNTDTPTSRYAGLSVYDSGSTLSTASFYYDGQTNDWGYEYSSSAGVDYAVTIFGPEYSTKGTPTYLTTNKIPKAVDNHHLNDSNISDNGSLITLGSNTSVTGTLVATGTSLVSGSSQITISSTTGYSTFSSSIATTISNLGSTYATDAELSSVSGAFATTIGNLDSTYATDASVTSISGAFATTIGNLGSTYATDAELSSVSGAVATTIANLGSTYATDAELSTVSGAFATTIGNLDSTYATDASVTSVSGAFATTISNLGSTYATDAELSSLSSSVATRNAGQDTTITTLSSSVASRLGTLETKDITITLTGDVTGTGTITDLGNVSFATTVAANSVALGTDTTGNYMSDVSAGTGVSVSHTPGEGSTATISIGQSVATSATPSFDQVFATNNGNGTNFKVGDDAWIGDVSIANTIKIKGQQDAAQGYICFGNQTTALGLNNSTTLTWGASFTATGDVTAYSDRRVKENIKTIDGALDKVLKLRGVTYNRIDTEDKSEKIGVIAQEMQEVLPQVVHDEGDKLSVAYGNLAGIFIEAIKEQQIQIHKLTLEIETLKLQKGL